MLKQEFEERIGFEISESEFNSANEQYINCNLDKDKFAKAYKAYYFALHPEKKAKLKENKRRAQMSNKEKVIEDITKICKTVKSEYPVNDFNIDISRIKDDNIFRFYFLLRFTGSEIYLNENELNFGDRNVNEWKYSRKELYYIEANADSYKISLVEKY